MQTERLGKLVRLRILRVGVETLKWDVQRA
jgi:hypothetical protein